MMTTLARASKWRIVVSLVLAVLFLYNPYQACACSSGGLSVSHRASYRATVGSSELQHFTPAERRAKAVVRDAVVFELLVFLPSATVTFFPHPDEQVRSARPVFDASLWFRPPPAR